MNDYGYSLQQQAERDAAERLVLLLKNRGVETSKIQAEVLKLIRIKIAEMKRTGRL